MMNTVNVLSEHKDPEEFDLETADAGIWEYLDQLPQDMVPTKISSKQKALKDSHKEHEQWKATRKPVTKKDPWASRSKEQKEKETEEIYREVSKFLDTESILKDFDKRTSKLPDNVAAAEFYKESAAALLKQRLDVEARKAEEERILNLGIARRNRIEAKKREQEQIRLKRAKDLERNKLKTIHNTLMSSSNSYNGGLFFCPNVSFQEPVTPLPEPSTQDFWDRHMHLTMKFKGPWVNEFIGEITKYCVTIQLRDAKKLDFLVPNKKWRELKNYSTMGCTIEAVCIHVQDEHGDWNLDQMPLFSKNDGKFSRTIDNPRPETCIVAINGITEEPGRKMLTDLLDVIQKSSLMKVTGMRTVYLTDQQKQFDYVRRAEAHFGATPNPLLMLCVTGKNHIVREKLESALGPLDPEIARKLKPDSIRAKHGTSREERYVYVSRSSMKTEPGILAEEASFFFGGRLKEKKLAMANEATHRLNYCF